MNRAVLNEAKHSRRTNAKACYDRHQDAYYDLRIQEQLASIDQFFDC